MPFAPAARVPGPPRLPLPYGLFSVVSLAETSMERWENGVTWEPLTCDPVAVAVGDCDTPEGFPLDFPDGGPDWGTAGAITVYGTYKCSPIGRPLGYAQDQAQAVLLAREEQAVEARLWSILDDAPTVLTLPPSAPEALGALEVWIGDEYGSLGVIHVSRMAATTLAGQDLIAPRGSQMQTMLGTPVVVGSGYPGTGADFNEVQTIQVTPGAGADGTFTLGFSGQVTGPIAHDATAAQVETALEGLSNIEPGDVTCADGPLGTNPVEVTFGGNYDGVDVPLMSVEDVSLLVDAAVAVALQTNAGGTPPTTGSEWIAATPALFGYRSGVYDFTSTSGDLLDRASNNLYGIAARNYLLGMDPCGVAFAEMPLGCCEDVTERQPG